MVIKSATWILTVVNYGKKKGSRTSSKGLGNIKEYFLKYLIGISMT